MPGSKYLKYWIDRQEVDLDSLEEFPISLSYRLEDPTNFQNKKSSESFGITTPATKRNDQIANTFHNPAVEDLSPGQSYRSFRRACVEANGYELLVGKALLTNARHASRPVSYEWDNYGNNGDWIIDLSEATLFDFLKQITFDFTKDNIIASWAYNGTDENLPYVFAPVRFGQQLDPYTGGATPVVDANMAPAYMKPSISIYWLIYWGFKSLGYKISSDFFDSPYFRKQVMPWTWGNFLFSEGTRLDTLDFLAKSDASYSKLDVDFTGFWDLHVINDAINGAFDNNNVYTYDGVAFEMKWEYLSAFNYGTLEGTFHLNMAVNAFASWNSDVELRVQWFKNGIRVPNGNDNGNGTLLVNLNPGSTQRRDFIGQVDDWFTSLVSPSDIISAKIYLHTFDSALGRARITASVDAFELDYFRVPLGGTIQFENYSALKKYKFLEFLGGVLDLYNISPQTDPINKVVYMEPLHDYSLTNNLANRAGGYINGNIFDWNRKQDNSKISEIRLNSEGEREQLFKFKEDSSDGLLKVVQDRFANVMGLGKYALPERFKAGKQEYPNRFFAPTMHVELDQWKGLGSDPDASPQIVCLVPENVANTSRDEAQNTFVPKICFYKGLIDHVGWIFDNEVQSDYPFMFAVNYQTGGQQDPILSYSDERIGVEGEYILGKGLVRRFYLQRMSIKRNGQDYTTNFKLKNIDIANWLHREYIICSGQKWEMVEIKDYKPLTEKSTECFMRKWSPITEADSDNIFPSNNSVLDVSPATGSLDMKYAPMKCLISDIPKPE
jgi:hypothetical protein